MTYFNKPVAGAGNLETQDDHYWRLCEISFRHLQSAYVSRQNQSEHEWVVGISNDDPLFGRSDYLHSITQLGVAKSSEYTHSLAAIVFSPAWMLSAANYYCQTNETVIGSKFEGLNALAKSLGLSKTEKKKISALRTRRNEILHLYQQTDGDELANLDFYEAYSYVKSVWFMYESLLRKFGIQPDQGAWKIQTNKYSLPESMTV